MAMTPDARWRALARRLDAHLMRDAGVLPRWQLEERPVREIALPFRWARRDAPVRFHHTLHIDAPLRGRPLLLRLDVAEGLLLLDGEPWHGLDRNHHDVVLPDSRTAVPTIALTIEASCATPFGGAWFRDARVAPHRPQVHRLAHWVGALADLHATLPAGPNRRRVADLLDDVEHVLGARRGAGPTDDDLARAADLVEASVRETADAGRGRGRGHVHLVGHSHIDVVWLWTLAETRRKCARTFSTMLRLMERYPEFCYEQSQAQLYQFVKETYPGLYEQVRERVRDGRWHPVGSTWVEPDCNIPNGESLIRQIQHGRRFFESEFGVASDVLWLPDTFGYAWSLPQILRQFGIRAFFTTKLSWNDTTRVPHHSFWWEGLDGTRVLAHNPPVGLEGLVTAGDLRKNWRDYRECARTAHVLQTYGYGDGGGGVTAEQLDAAHVLGAAPGLQRSELSSVARFFDSLRRDGARLPVWRDELYLELHRGTYTTHAWLKRANRRAEAALYTTELLCALALPVRGPAGTSEASATLDTLWKRLLLNQFHDIVPGTAIEAAYEDTQRDFAALEEGCQSLREAALDDLAPVRPSSAPGAFTVFNPLPWDRVEKVRLPAGAGRLVVSSGDGQVVPSQAVREKDGTSVLCSVQIPALGCVTLVPVAETPGRHGRAPAPEDQLELDGPLVRVRFAPDGTIRSLVDKTSGRDVVLAGRRLNEFQAFRDEPLHWEAWDIDPEYERKPVDLFGRASVRVLERGPVRWRARVEMRSAGRTRLEQDVVAYHDSARVEFVTRVRWHERRTLLKVAFPLAVRASHATYEIPLGAICRPTLARTLRDRARWEVAGQQWADLSGRGFGVSLLNDSKYGYDCHGRVLRLTLIRSPRYPHHAEPKTKTSGRYTDQGEHRFTYVLLPHVGTWREAETVRRARELNVPCVVVPGHREMQVTALLRLDAPNIQVSAITPGDTPNTVLVRLYEAHGVAGPARVQLGWPCDETCEIGLDEKVRRVLSSREGAVRLTFRPFEIKTLRLTPALTPMPALTASAKARAVSPGATPDREETSDAR